MKNVLNIIIITLIFASCDPDVPGEGINLPVIDFKIAIDKDTSHIKLGDTIIINSITSTSLSKGIKIKDGVLKVNCAMAYTSDSAFLNEANIGGPIIGQDILFVTTLGNIDISPSGDIRQFKSYPNLEFFEFEIKIIPFKIGTYFLSLQSNFFEGTQGKTRTNPYFNIVKNNGEELWQVPGMPAITPDDPAYKTIYYFAVTE